MSIALTLVRQCVIMFLLAGIGFLLFKTGRISREGSKSLGNILIYVVLPCVIVNSFLVERTQERMVGLLISAAAAVVVLALCVVVSRLIFRKDAIAAFAASFSNPGFFGIPLILASIGKENVFYIAAFIAFLNLLQWSYGVALLTGQRGSLQPKALLKAPFMIAIAIGLVLFFSGVQLPALVTDTLSSITAVNTPLAMFVTGVYLAQTDLLHMLRRPRLYAVSAVRLVLLPALAALVLWPLPAAYTGLKTALLIAAACPVGSNIAVYAQLHNKDYAYAVETVVISTLLSILTLPCLVMATQWLWGLGA